MGSRKLRVGIVGAGSVATDCHVPGWLAHPDVEIAAICDINKRAAVTLAAAAGATQVLTDYKKLAALKEIDIVDVCTPNRAHTPVVKAALAAGKHVICEKPLAVSVRDVQAMGRLARAKRRKLMTAQHYRYSPMAIAGKRFLGSGGLGTPYHARVYATRSNLVPTGYGFIDESLSGGGPCMDIGVHALDLCMHLMDFPKPVRVSGSARVNFAKGRSIRGAWGQWNRRRFTVEDFASGFVHFDNGATMALEASWLGHQEDTEDISTLIYGTGGTIQWPTGKYWSTRDGVAYATQLTEPDGLPRAYTAELHAFYDCVVNQKPSPVPWEQTVQVIAILEGIYKSSRTGREIKIKL